MTHNPPTSQQLDLDAIQARIDAASKGPWKLAYEYCDCSEDCGHGLYVSRIDTGSGPATELCDLPRGEWELMVHARADVEQLVDEVRRLRAQGAAIEGLERAFTAELDDTNALALVDALIVLRSKLPCTCARSRGLHEKACQRYVPGHDLLSGQSRLAQARAEMRPAVRPAVETGA